MTKKKNVYAGFRAFGSWLYDPKTIPEEAYLLNTLHVVAPSTGSSVVTVSDVLCSEPETNSAEQYTTSEIGPLVSDYTLVFAETLLLMEAYLSEEQQAACNNLFSRGYRLEPGPQFLKWKIVKELASREVRFK